MSPIRFKVPDHMIVPFACPKWEIDDIKIAGVSTDGTYFQSEAHCAHLSLRAQVPLRLSRFFHTWALETPDGAHEAHEALAVMRDLTKDFGNLQTPSERLFVDLYFNWVHGHWNWHEDRANHQYGRELPDDSRYAEELSTDTLFGTLLPLPQAHVYARDPFVRFSWTPDRMYKLDFAFWTGEELVGVEIDGPSHRGSPDHVTKDRNLQRAGVHVVHILNEELSEHRENALTELLPESVLYGWKRRTKGYVANPFVMPF